MSGNPNIPNNTPNNLGAADPNNVNLVNHEGVSTAVAATAGHSSEHYRTNAHLLVTNSPDFTAAIIGAAWQENTPLRFDLKKQYITGGNVIPTLNENGELAVSTVEMVVRSAAKRGSNDRALCLDCLVVGKANSIPGGRLVGCVPLNKDGSAIKVGDRLVRENIDLPLPEGSAVQIAILTDLEYGAVEYIQTDELGVEFRHDPTYKSIITDLHYCLPNPNPHPNGLNENEMTFTEDDEDE